MNRLKLRDFTRHRGNGKSILPRMQETPSFLPNFSGERIEMWRPAIILGRSCALSSAVEHFLHTEGVAGSNPAARTILHPAPRFELRLAQASKKSGAQRCADVSTPWRRFLPPRRDCVAGFQSAARKIQHRFELRTVCRLEIGDTADWKSALQTHEAPALSDECLVKALSESLRPR